MQRYYALLLSFFMKKEGLFKQEQISDLCLQNLHVIIWIMKSSRGCGSSAQ